MHAHPPPWTSWLAVAAVALLWSTGCAELGDPQDAIDTTDTDGDGLFDTFEAEIGTEVEVADTDGDGWSDGEEWAQYTHPLDETDYEYLDGNGARVWDHYPYPFDLEGEGNAYGDVLWNITLPNYWVQDTHLYSFYGNVVLVVATADS